MRAKYIVMARNYPIHVIMDAYGVRPMECIFITKNNRGSNIMGLIPKGMKVLRYKPNGVYDLDKLYTIPDDDDIARYIRNQLIAEAKCWDTD